MIEGKSTINGEVIWRYDEHWRNNGLAFTTKAGEAVEIFFDDERNVYYLANHSKNKVKAFNKDGEILSFVETVGVSAPSRRDIKPLIPIVRTVIQPDMPFGFYMVDKYTRKFNLFNQTKHLAILNNPDLKKETYKKPTTIINFFKSLVPDNFMRHYLLRFIKFKLKTFDYSPVVLYLIGAHGSGKDTLVNMLGTIVGENHVGKPTVKEFLENFNGWLVDKYFIQLDEYGNQLTRHSDKAEALGKIKAYSGKETLQIRQMRTDGFMYKHRSTFILTANNNPLMLEAGDRRVALFETPNKLENEPWVKEAGGISKVIDKIQFELFDFCYYLATEVSDITKDEYVSPPETKAKNKIILDKLSAADKIAYTIHKDMIDELIEMCEDYSCSHVLANYQEGRIYEDDLFELYINMTDGHGTKRGMNKALSNLDIDKIPTTKNGVKAHYYNVKSLKFSDITPFEPVNIKAMDIDL
jgi:hypothetical protein